MSDFLGYFSRANKFRDYLSYEDAKKWATSWPRNLVIKNQKEWITYTVKYYNDIKMFPENIPIKPQTIYKKKGWTNYGDFLDYKIVKGYNYKSELFCSYEDAKIWIKNLDIKFRSISDWHNYCLTNQIPKKIPKNPSSAYKNKGWLGPADYLGYKKLKRNKLDKDMALTYEAAKKFALTLNLINPYQWQKFVKKYSQTDLFPKNMPTNPDVFYKNKGWLDWEDFLGIEIKREKKSSDNKIGGRKYWY